jgi:hypothetical protein
MLLTEKAQKVVDLFVQKANEVFGKRIISIFKIGSLGTHGGFSSCSDVDVAIFLDHIDAADYDAMQKINGEIKALPLEFADRLSVFWSSYDENLEKGLGRFPPLDRLDLLEYGSLIQGKDHREKLLKPTQEDLVLESAKFILDYMLKGEKLDELLHHPEKISEQGARYFSKFILFPVRLLYTIDNPMAVGSNEDALNHFLKNYKSLGEQVIDLLKAGFQARSINPYKEIDFTVDSKTLKLLYNECVKKYYEATKLTDNYLSKELSRILVKINEGETL